MGVGHFYSCLIPGSGQFEDDRIAQVKSISVPILQKEHYICSRCGAEIYVIEGSVTPAKGNGGFDACPVARNEEHVWRHVPNGLKKDDEEQNS